MLRKHIPRDMFFAKTATLWVCEYCDKIQRRHF
jgi:hypothetical protein